MHLLSIAISTITVQNGGREGGGGGGGGVMVHGGGGCGGGGCVRMFYAERMCPSLYAFSGRFLAARSAHLLTR